MVRQNTYGKRSKKSKAERLFAELPQSPLRQPPQQQDQDSVVNLTEKLSFIQLEEHVENIQKFTPKKQIKRFSDLNTTLRALVDEAKLNASTQGGSPLKAAFQPDNESKIGDLTETEEEGEEEEEEEEDQELRILSWDDVCSSEDRIEKIAEASSAEVYRVTNDHGTSIIKVIRLHSPIKAKTKAQIQAKLVDEQPHSEMDLNGELQISQWLADIPGFVVYKERYVVQGKATKELLATHQKFQRRLKRQDPGRAQFYPSPSRYLDDTKFLVVELGDAGMALEDWSVSTVNQLWDIFFLVAIALARAEDLAMFEHRDLHESNVCIRQVREPLIRPPRGQGPVYGYSGLDITILDYGLSRAEDLAVDYAKPVSYDLEKDLSFFTSTHALQCNVYRQMRSFLLRADRRCLAPEAHKTPYAKGVNGPLSWEVFAPYTNVLWLAYLYNYLVDNFKGEKAELAQFRETAAELWTYLDPNAGDETPCFGSAADVVCFAVEAGWVEEEQLVGSGASILVNEESIILPRNTEEDDNI